MHVQELRCDCITDYWSNYWFISDTEVKAGECLKKKKSKLYLFLKLAESLCPLAYSNNSYQTGSQYSLLQ